MFLFNVTSHVVKTGHPSGHGVINHCNLHNDGRHSPARRRDRSGSPSSSRPSACHSRASTPHGRSAVMSVAPSWTAAVRCSPSSQAQNGSGGGRTAGRSPRQRPPPRSADDEDAWTTARTLRAANASYELSQDLHDKYLEMLERTYGGQKRVCKAATVIQHAYRHYCLGKNFERLRCEADGRRQSWRFKDFAAGGGRVYVTDRIMMMHDGTVLVPVAQLVNGPSRASRSVLPGDTRCPDDPTSSAAKQTSDHKRRSCPPNVSSVLMSPSISDVCVNTCGSTTSDSSGASIQSQVAAAREEDSNDLFLSSSVCHRHADVSNPGHGGSVSRPGLSHANVPSCDQQSTTHMYRGLCQIDADEVMSAETAATGPETYDNVDNTLKNSVDAPGAVRIFVDGNETDRLTNKYPAHDSSDDVDSIRTLTQVDAALPSSIYSSLRLCTNRHSAVISSPPINGNDLLPPPVRETLPPQTTSSSWHTRDDSRLNDCSPLWKRKTVASGSLSSDVQSLTDTSSSASGHASDTPLSSPSTASEHGACPSDGRTDRLTLNGCKKHAAQCSGACNDHMELPPHTRHILLPQPKLSDRQRKRAYRIGLNLFNKQVSLLIKFVFITYSNIIFYSFFCQPHVSIGILICMDDMGLH